MRTVILLFWILVEVAKTLVLQPSLNVSSPQNVSLEGEIWTELSPDHLQHPPAGEEEQLKWEKEPGTQITVTIKEEDGTNFVHGETFGQDVHEILKEGEEQHGESSDKQGQDQKQEMNKTRNEQIQEENQSRHQSISPSVDTPLFTFLPSQYFSPTTTTRGSADITKTSSYIKGQNTSRSSHFSTSMPSTNENSTDENSSLGQIESSEEEASLTVMAARAGPTAMSLPNTIKEKGNTKIPKIKDKLKKKGKKGKAKSGKPMKNAKHVKKVKQDQNELTTTPYFPYFEDHYCPPDCACYGRVVQCSDKRLDKIPYGIPYNSRYVLLMNNRIVGIPLYMLSEYLSMEFLVLSNNRLVDSSIAGAFEGIQALKRLYLDRNLLQSVPTDLPASLEELRLDGNKVKVISEVAWFRCPGLLILSLSNNSLESTSSSFHAGVFSPLTSLRTLSLSHNRLTSVPLHLPLCLQELYLRGNLIEHFQSGIFQGKAQLQVLDLSGNKLTNKGLGKNALINSTHLESLNLEGNFLKQVPRYLPRSLRTLNLEGNSISSISKGTFFSLPHLEHLGLARNKIYKVASGAFRMLPLLHQLDLSHNVLHQVPRQLPAWLIYVALNHNKIEKIPRDAFCSFEKSDAAKSRLVKVQLEHNLVGLGSLDSINFSCLRGFQVVHLY
ncbi:extracellular matrix protein 2-like [Clarias magur]|uniref:Extracellular matrix protein 2-like n=1 Tax=Clarias magur TaxID=1594786 RepID=A0A8J4WRR6_CLAMG|nr:extracellular matrix protein 2-like [Clarias magur]